MQQPNILSKYKRGPGGSADEFQNVMDDSAPFVQPVDEPIIEIQAGQQGYVQAQPQHQASGPIQELIQLAVNYGKTNPSDLSHMLERIRLSKRMSALIPEIVAEAEEGREKILEELGMTPPKPVKRPRAVKKDVA